VLTALIWILDGIELIGSYVLWALETCVNAVLAAIVGVYVAVVALLPSMSGAPSIGSPTWLQWMNWFYPVGDLVAGLTGLLGLWIAYLAVRYILRLVRGL
jgi:hypothetical protein